MACAITLLFAQLLPLNAYQRHQFGELYYAKQADAALGAANITVNKNAVPNDPQSPFVTSGIRVGTPALTTRGCGEAEARELAGWMCDVMDDVENQETIAAVRDKVLELCKRYPVYG